MRLSGSSKQTLPPFPGCEAQPSSALLSLNPAVTQICCICDTELFIRILSDGGTVSGLLFFPMKFLSAAENRASLQPHDSGLPCFSAIHIKFTSDPSCLVTLFDCLRRVLQRLEAIKSNSLKMSPQSTAPF